MLSRRVFTHPPPDLPLEGGGDVYSLPFMSRRDGIPWDKGRAGVGMGDE
jgi:hypothetical protein